MVDPLGGGVEGGIGLGPVGDVAAETWLLDMLVSIAPDGVPLPSGSVELELHFPSVGLLQPNGTLSPRTSGVKVTQTNVL